MTHELPEGWASATTANLAAPYPNAFTIGPFGSNLKVSDYTTSGVPLVFVRDIRAERFGGDGTKFVSTTKAAELASHAVRGGDVLVTKMGEPPGDTAVYPLDRPPGVITADCIKLTPYSGVTSSAFLRLCIRSPLVRDQIAQQTMGVAQQKLSLARFREVTIPLPPLPEQRRIVEKVEALLEQVNRAKERLERVPRILKRFRQAVLAAACSGELTEEWRVRHRDRESAAALLDDLFVQRRREHERRLSSAREKATRRPTTPRNLEPAKVPDSLPELPNGWAWVLFDDVCDDITVGHVGPMASEYVERGIPFLRSQNVRPFRFDPQGLKYITPAFHQRLAKSALKPGDIAVVRSGSAGEACVIPKELTDSNCADLVVMRPSHGLDAYFAAIFINSSAARSHIDDVKVGIAQGHYNIGSARETPVPLPPLAEQTEIVRRVEKLFALAETIERRVATAMTRANKLPLAILSKAFSGELVPTEAEVARAEGRTYETAEEMLARVRRDSENGAAKEASGVRQALGGAGDAAVKGRRGGRRKTVA